MNLRWIVWIALIGLAGCSSAKMISTTDGSSGPRGGVIEYRGSGVSAASELRDADRQMREFCGPEPHRVIETTERIESLPAGYGDEIHVTWIQARFECGNGG